MKKIYLDTNIIIDLLIERVPFSKYAIQIFKKAEEQSIVLYTSSHSIATTHYILKKYIDEKKLREILNDLIDLVNIVPVDLEILRSGLNSKYKDFEDSIQIYCANNIKDISFIVTRNIKDFKDSEITALPPEQAIEFI
ncbi:MAG: PIN domain-containing protein [Cytophagaceae bacterium]|nr:PIN domain-containing protein [Cytophagaceae bacterium]MBL0327097.1 PIN domain-containing protein [Cytophagaceae bacterium]